MDFVDKEHISRFQGSEQAGQVSGFVQHRTGSHLHVHSHLVGNDMGQRGFSQAGRAVEQHMVQSLPSEFGGLYINAQIGYNLLLTGKVIKPLRADNSVKFIIFAPCCIVRIEFVHSEPRFNSDTNIVFLFLKVVVLVWLLKS